MVDVEEFPPVVSVVDLVSLSVELAGQEVEQLLRLPAQEGEPVLKYSHLTPPSSYQSDSSPGLPLYRRSCISPPVGSSPPPQWLPGQRNTLERERDEKLVSTW